MLADGERHPSTRKRFGSVSGSKLVSISPVLVWVALSGVCGELRLCR